MQAEILELLRDLRDRLGSAILLITHNMGVVADLADRVVVMNAGKVVETATVAKLFAASSEDYTRTLVAAVPHLGQGNPERQPTEEGLAKLGKVRAGRGDLPTRWTLRQGGWISGRGGCYTVQPRRQHRPPAWVYPAGLVPHLGPRVLGRGHPAPRAGDWSCRCRRKLLGRGTSTPCIPMVGADAASGSTGWKIPAPAGGFVHLRSHFRLI